MWCWWCRGLLARSRRPRVAAERQQPACGSVGGGPGCLLLEAVAEAPGLGAGVDDVGAVGEAVDDGLGEPGVGEHLRPFAEREVGGDDQRAAFVALGEDLEDELG